jgi:predicted RNA-binding Zn ribbon-like protein
VSPRYDIPNAAPEPLRQVQLFVNSTDLENQVDWLPDWLAEHGIPRSAARARELREALRALLLANNGRALDGAALTTVNRLAARVHPTLDRRLRLGFEGDPDPLQRLVAIVFGAVSDGSWQRLKACRNCHWSFYDYSPNRSATWCSMQICGNRSKTRAYRRRRRAEPA